MNQTTEKISNVQALLTQSTAAAKGDGPGRPKKTHDISEECQKALKPFAKEIKANAQRGKFDKKYSDKLKEGLVSIRGQFGLSYRTLEINTGVSHDSLRKWGKEFGKHLVHISHGKTTRNNIRSKCLAVKDYAENNVSKEHLADKHHVGKGTITSWIREYGEDFQYWIDSADDRVQTLAKEERLIIGDENIAEVRAFMMIQQDELRDMIQQMQKHGIMANAIAQAEKRSRETEEDLDILDKADAILQKKKVV